MAAGSGQTLGDRLNAFRYALAGQGLARTVCKATTLEVLAPKRKHMDYLVACTNEPNISIPQLANLLIERSQHSNWAVVFKALISIHHLMSYGNERFTQYLATSNHSFELPDFLDRTTPHGYNMSSFVRRYAKYVDDKSVSYRALAIDLCKIKSGNDNALRTMNMDNLSKSIPILQKQFDSLLDFGAEPKDLNNGIVMSAFRLLYKDLVRIYVAYQEAIINLLERYFKLSRKKTREALEMYKNYLVRMDKVDSFLRVVEAVELDKSEMPDLKNSPASILKLLEQHLAQLEARKKGATPVGNQVELEEEGGAEKEEKKENEPVQEKTPVVVGLGETGPSQAEESIKHKPPPKPARPSPRASPAVSPKTSPKVQPPPRPSSSNAPSPSPKPSSSAGTSKKGQPERPAKPPSRPPPPSATTTTTSNTTTTSTTSPAPQKSAKTATEPDHVPTTSTMHTAPPPHPPPPSHPIHPITSHNTSPTDPPETTQDDSPTAGSLTTVVARELNGKPPVETQTTPQLSDDSVQDDNEQPTAGCGSTANTDEQSQVESQAIAQEDAHQEVNQVQENSVNHRLEENGHEEEDFPDPPPAVEESDEIARE